jgi:hypothetical protein
MSALIDVLDLGDPRYIAELAPEAFPNQRRAVVANWSVEEREAYCGIYTPAHRKAIQIKADHIKRHGAWPEFERNGS